MASHLVNLQLTVVLNWKTPYEILHGVAPTYNTLRVFGSLCYATNTLPSKDKFSPRAHPCIFLGYPAGTKGYTLLDLTSQTIFHSCDVSFREHIFPYQVLFSNPVSSSSSYLPIPIPATLSPSSSYSPSVPSAPSPPPSFQNNTPIVSLFPLSSPNSSSPPLSPSLPSLVAPSVPLRCSSRPHHAPSCMQGSVPSLFTTTPLILISCSLLYLIRVFLPNFRPSESLPIMWRSPFPLVGLRPYRPSSKPLHLIIPGISPLSLPGNILSTAGGFKRSSCVLMVLLNALKLVWSQKVMIILRASTILTVFLQ